MTLPPITTKQQEVLQYIPRFRFLDRTHLQQLLRHKDKRRINSWLKDLIDKQYITRMYDNKIIGKNRIPAIYYLSSNGIRYVKTLGMYDQTLLHKLYYEKNRSIDFISQCLLIASICCSLEEKNNPSVTYNYITKSDFLYPDNEFYFLEQNKSIDLCFSKKQTGKKKQYYLLTVFPKSLPRYRVRKRIHDYLTFYTDNPWEDYSSSPFPTLLFACETKELLIYAKRQARILLEENDSSYPSFHFATVDDVRKHDVTGEIWEKV